MNIQKKRAKEFVKKYRLTNKTLSIERIKYIIKALGFKLYSHNKYGRSDEFVQPILEGIGLADYSIGKDAFTYVTVTDKAVFYHRQLSDDEALYLLLHEIGHIICGHSVKKGILAFNDVTAEKEANEFTFYVYEYVTKNKAKKVTAVCAAVFLSAVIFSVIPRLQPPAPDVPKTHMENGSKNVYITKSGERYHNSWCSYVTGKSNIITLGLSEAESAGYSPCFYCKPDITD